MTHSNQSFRDDQTTVDERIIFTRSIIPWLLRTFL